MLVKASLPMIVCHCQFIANTENLAANKARSEHRIVPLTKVASNLLKWRRAECCSSWHPKLPLKAQIAPEVSMSFCWSKNA